MKPGPTPKTSRRTPAHPTPGLVPPPVLDELEAVADRITALADLIDATDDGTRRGFGLLLADQADRLMALRNALEHGTA